jgi:hypothetical protein
MFDLFQKLLDKVADRLPAVDYCIAIASVLAAIIVSSYISKDKEEQSRLRRRLVPGGIALAMGLCLIPVRRLLFPQNQISALQSAILAESDFEQGDEGWQGTNSVNGPQALTHEQGGATSHSLGYISVSENRGGQGTMYFAAPAEYLNNKRSAYNGRLVFRLKQSADRELTDARDFVYLGSGDLVLSYMMLRKVPPTNWQGYEIPLNECSGWLNINANRVATKSEMLSVLSSLSRLWIRAEFSNQNYDRTDLDNVIMFASPTESTEHH